MANFLNQQLTDVGWNALSTALGGGRLTFFKMQAGDGTITSDNDIPPMTALVHPVCDVGITSYKIEGKGQITLIGSIASAQLDAGFTFRELGIFATIEQPVQGQGGSGVVSIPAVPGGKANPVVPDPSYGTIHMYSYCNSYDNSDYIPGKGETTDVINTIQVTVKIDKAADIQIIITVGEQLSIVNIGAPEVGAGVWRDTIANVAYLKRFKVGSPLEMIETEDTITFRQKQLTADIDLYVAYGNPDISPHFSTLQKAINYLGDYLIPAYLQARIWISPGVYRWNNTYLNHPNSQNIIITGAWSPKIWGNRLDGISGSAWNWTVTFGGFTDTSSIHVGDWVIIDEIWCDGAIAEGMLCGYYEVIGVNPTQVAVRNCYKKASWQFPVLHAVALTAIKTRIVVDPGYVGFITGKYGVACFQYVGFQPSRALAGAEWSCGILVNGPSTLNFVGAWYFDNPLQTSPYVFTAGIWSGVQATLWSCAASLNQVGISGTGDWILIKCSVSHSRFRGYWFERANVGIIYGVSRCAESGEVGFILANGSGGAIMHGYGWPSGYLYCHDNDQWNVYIVNGSSMVWGSADCYFALFNAKGINWWNKQPTTPYDLVVDGMSVLSGQAYIWGSRIFNIPPNNIISQQGGLIR